MNDALPTHPNPNSVDVPMTSATQAQVGPNMSPDANKNQTDNSWCDEEEREE